VEVAVAMMAVAEPAAVWPLAAAAAAPAAVPPWEGGPPPGPPSDPGPVQLRDPDEDEFMPPGPTDA